MISNLYNYPEIKKHIILVDKFRSDLMKQLTGIICCCLLMIQAAIAASADTITIRSDAMQRDYNCVVITPEGYQTASRRYPVVYLLHGHGGNYANWISKVPAIRDLADRYQCLIICPDGGYNSWYLNSPVDSTMKFETYIGSEVPAYIDRHYATLPDARHRAITGLSMGGHGALLLAIRHPEMFGAAGSMSGGVDIIPFPKSWELVKWLGDPVKQAANWQANTVINVADRLQPGQLSLIVDCGVKDFFIDVNRALHQKLLQRGIAHDYTERAGGHSWEYWGNAIAYHLLFFHRFFEAQ